MPYLDGRPFPWEDEMYPVGGMKDYADSLYTKTRKSWGRGDVYAAPDYSSGLRALMPTFPDESELPVIQTRFGPRRVATVPMNSREDQAAGMSYFPFSPGAMSNGMTNDQMVGDAVIRNRAKYAYPAGQVSKSIPVDEYDWENPEWEEPWQESPVALAPLAPSEPEPQIDYGTMMDNIALGTPEETAYPGEGEIGHFKGGPEFKSGEYYARSGNNIATNRPEFNMMPGVNSQVTDNYDPNQGRARYAPNAIGPRLVRPDALTQAQKDLMASANDRMAMRRPLSKEQKLDAQSDRNIDEAKAYAGMGVVKDPETGRLMKTFSPTALAVAEMNNEGRIKVSENTMNALLGKAEMDAETKRAVVNAMNQGQMLNTLITSNNDMSKQKMELLAQLYENGIEGEDAEARANVAILSGIKREEQLVNQYRPAQPQSSAPARTPQPQGRIKPITQAAYDALPYGAVYIDPGDGKKHRKQ